MAVVGAVCLCDCDDSVSGCVCLCVWLYDGVCMSCVFLLLLHVPWIALRSVTCRRPHLLIPGVLESRQKPSNMYLPVHTLSLTQLVATVPGRNHSVIVCIGYANAT